jgi:hypothetical protein
MIWSPLRSGACRAVAFLLLVGVGCKSTPEPAAAPERLGALGEGEYVERVGNTFLAFSDFHLDPFDQSEAFPSVDGDTNAYMLRRMIGASAAEATRNDETPTFILVAGDLLAHHFADKVNQGKPSAVCKPGATVSVCATSTIELIVNEIKTTQNGVFSSTPIYLVPGNNDFAKADYHVNLTDLRALAEIYWAAAFPDAASAPDKSAFVDDMAAHGGAYRVAQIPKTCDTKCLSFLALNTVPYSDDADLTCDRDGVASCTSTDACDCFRSAQKTFISASLASGGRPDFVAMHVPDVADAGWSGGRIGDLVDTGLFSTCSATAPDCAKMVFGGHWHQYRTNQQTASRGDVVPTQMLRAITPHKGVVPGFEIVEYDPLSGQLWARHLVDVTNYAASLASKSSDDVPFSRNTVSYR